MVDKKRPSMYCPEYIFVFNIGVIKNILCQLVCFSSLPAFSVKSQIECFRPTGPYDLCCNPQLWDWSRRAAIDQ